MSTGVASRAFRCERITYRFRQADGASTVTEIASVVSRTPNEALQHIRVDVRTHSDGLPPIVRSRARAWTDDSDDLYAMALLHRGRPCGFSLSGPDGWVEWTVRPVTALALIRCSEPLPCACSNVRPVGLGPLTVRDVTE